MGHGPRRRRAGALWYQIPTFDVAEDAPSTTFLQDNADAWILAVVGLLVILVPVLPGVRSVPRWVPVHRLFWRSSHRRHGDDHLL